MNINNVNLSATLSFNLAVHLKTVCLEELSFSDIKNLETFTRATGRNFYFSTVKQLKDKKFVNELYPKEVKNVKNATGDIWESLVIQGMCHRNFSVVFLLFSLVGSSLIN